MVRVSMSCFDVFLCFSFEYFGSFNFVGDRWFPFPHCVTPSIGHLAA